MERVIWYSWILKEIGKLIDIVLIILRMFYINFGEVGKNDNFDMNIILGDLEIVDNFFDKVLFFVEVF